MLHLFRQADNHTAFRQLTTFANELASGLDRHFTTDQLANKLACTENVNSFTSHLAFKDTAQHNRTRLNETTDLPLNPNRYIEIALYKAINTSVDMQRTA